MAVKKTKLGPGILTIGSAGSGKEFGGQVIKVSVEPDYSEGDVINVLSGDSDTTEGEFSGKLTAEFYQDYEKDSLIEFCWSNDGKAMPFEFMPSDSGVLTVKGEVRVRPVNIGGDVNKDNTTEIDWELLGKHEVKFSNTARDS